MTRPRRCSTQTLNLIAALLDQPGKWRHGYDLSQAAGLKAGTLYPILNRLSDRGLLESRWQESEFQGRPPRHMYRLTNNGKSYAREQLADSEPGYQADSLQANKA